MLLNEIQKQTLINKLKFTLTYMLKMNNDIENVFDVRVLDVDNNKVRMFELKLKNDDITYILFKRLCNNEFEVRYLICSESMMASEETTLKFIVGEEEGSDDDFEFKFTLEKLFVAVTEIEMERQFDKLNNSLNELIKF
jgi:hypothetical protein